MYDLMLVHNTISYYQLNSIAEKQCCLLNAMINLGDAMHTIGIDISDKIEFVFKLMTTSFTDFENELNRIYELYRDAKKKEQATE